MKRLLLAMLLVCLAAAASGCGDGSDADQPDTDSKVAQTASPASSVDSGASSSSSSEDSDSDGHSNGDSDSDSNGDSGDHPNGDSDGEHGEDDDTVSRQNPGLVGTAFDASRNEALFDAQPLNVVTWSTSPTISAGALEASGVLDEGVSLFNPMVDGEGAGFIVYYKGMQEPLVLLLPDLGPIDIWESDYTIAPMEHEFEGSSFSIRAYSPLFMDVGPSDLEIRLFGVDANGADAVLAVEPVSVE